MADSLLEPLDTPFVFNARPELIPADLRPLWRLASILLMLKIASRGGKSSFKRLHVLSWALRSQGNQQTLLRVIEHELKPDDVIVRIEPSLNRAVELAYAEGLLTLIGGDRIKLTERGHEESERILASEGVLANERSFLELLGKRLTEQGVTELFGRERLL